MIKKDFIHFSFQNNMNIGSIRFKYNSSEIPCRPNFIGGSTVRMTAEVMDLTFEVSEEEAQMVSDYFLNFIKECKKRKR